MTERTPAITELVAQLRNGEITKEEMFQKLNDLKKSKSKQQSEQPPPPPQAGSGVPESPNPFDSFGASGQIVEEEGMSIPTGTPDRKEVLQRMIQEKRAQKDLSLSAANNATKVEKERLKKMVEERRRKQVEKNRGEVDMSVNVSAIQGETTGSMLGMNDTTTTSLPLPPPKTTDKSKSARSTTTQNRRHPSPQVRASRSYRLNTTTTPSTVKTSLAQKTSSSELTFKPKIRPLPSGIYGGGTPNGGKKEEMSFEERTRRGSVERESKLREKREQKQSKELDGCTFNPAININSMRAAQMAKKDNRTVAERLYDERVHLAAKQQMRVKMQEREAEKAFEDAHTFKPEVGVVVGEGSAMKKVIRKRDGTPVQSRFRQVAASPCQRPTDKKDKQCSFTPKVTGVRGNMSSAKLYLKNDVFSRLQNGAKEGGGMKENENPVFDAADVEEEEPRPVMDMATFMNNVQKKKVVRPASAGRSRPNNKTVGSARKARASSAGRSRPNSAAGKTTTTDSAQFHAFLARQNQTELKKKQKIDHLKRQQQQTHKPVLCSTTVNLTQDRKQEDFLKRLKQYQVRKDHQQIKLQAQHNTDPECTFRPALNSKSNNLAEGGRSVVELSRGDHLRKETTQKMLRLRHEQSQMKELTFAPQVNHSNKVARNATSRLKIVEDPDNYLSRLQQSAKNRKDVLRRKAQELEMKTLQECTFRPETSECPGYIKRIARSMALTKVDRQESIEAGKPEWK
ncbi:hypothetical protein TrLO_g113 [Triparma laevis f. longispina]|uniref:Uncharacterized protein n=1 Tax=Triparma laevis f. longispina TaxID=1714387 RepID=A0A9W7C796_9STRA|nr:hypothetical protein TrLO_g113 [Triparma laevis f. longispina]